jgi:hypothetical protein
MEFFNDDKNIVIMAITGILVLSIIMFGIQSKEIVQMGLSGLLGLAMGKKI